MNPNQHNPSGLNGSYNPNGGQQNFQDQNFQQNYPNNQGQQGGYDQQAQQFMNNMPNQEVINMGISTGTKIFQDRVTQMMPGASQFWMLLKSYFQVLRQ